MNRNDELAVRLILLCAVFLLTMLLISIYASAQVPPITAPKGYSSNAEVFLGWMKYSAHVQIRF
ncbi:hypothetical protein LCGC14_2612020, partial [marine sediment metagenome]